MKFLILIAFVSSCGPYKSDACSIASASRVECENADVKEIVLSMRAKGELCGAVIDFLEDTAMDHDFEIDCDDEQKPKAWKLVNKTK